MDPRGEHVVAPDHRAEWAAVVRWGVDHRAVSRHDVIRVDKQQCLLPGQSDLVVRLAAGRAERRPRAVRERADRPAPRNPTLRRKDFLRGEPLRPGDLPDVSWFEADGTGKHWEGSDPSRSACSAHGSAGGLAQSRPARDDPVPCRREPADVHGAALRPRHRLAVIHRHGRRTAARHRSGLRRPLATGERHDPNGKSIAVVVRGGGMISPLPFRERGRGCGRCSLRSPGSPALARRTV